jgi:hypothetical protein
VGKKPSHHSDIHNSVNFKFSDRPNNRGGKTRGGKETLKMGVRKLLRYPVFALAPIW